MLTPQLSEADSAEIAPVAAEDRVVVLDLWRGFAMFGVLWSNLNDWYGTYSATTAFDRGLSWMQQWVIESRFYSLLGFLFGIGFAIQLQRAEARGSDGRNVFLRRMLALLGFGLVHGFFIFSGDILAEYALVGFLLVLYRGLSQRRLVIAAALTYFLVMYVVPSTFLLLKLPPVWGFDGEAGAAIYAHGSFTQIALFRIQDYLLRLRGLATTGGFAEFLTLFLLGMLAVRAGILHKLSDRKWLWRSFAAALLCVAGGLYWSHSLQSWWPVSFPPDDATWYDMRFWLIRRVFSLFGRDLLIWGNSAAYASALALLLLRPGWNTKLGPLAAVGRMPLTTYLAQSLVCTTLFYGYGFGLWGRVGFTGMLSIALAVFGLQMIASVFWLRYFRFGPTEWLWRSLAYARPQRIKEALPSRS